MDINIKLNDNSDLVLNYFNKASNLCLEAIGLKAEDYAKKELSKAKPHKDSSIKPNVITGRLRNSITYKVKEKNLAVGTNVDYASFVELGTRKSWAYPYLKPALTEHTEEYKNIAQGIFKG